MSSIDNLLTAPILKIMGSAELDPLSNKAVEAALNNHWPEAIDFNMLLLKKYPKDVESLNRLARAYLESGRTSKAKSTYKAVLGIDPYNPIATKNVKRISELKSKGITLNPTETSNTTTSVSDLFLEEPGTTKIIQVTQLKSPKASASLRTADPVDLKNKYSATYVYNSKGKEVGVLDSFWGKKVASAIREGAKFEAYIVSADHTSENKISVFVRETYHPPKLENAPTFPIEKTEDFHPSVSEEAVSLITTENELPGSDEDGSSEHSTEGGKHTSLESLAQKEQDALDHLDEEN